MLRQGEWSVYLGPHYLKEPTAICMHGTPMPLIGSEQDRHLTQWSGPLLLQFRAEKRLNCATRAKWQHAHPKASFECCSLHGWCKFLNSRPVYYARPQPGQGPLTVRLISSSIWNSKELRKTAHTNDSAWRKFLVPSLALAACPAWHDVIVTKVTLGLDLSCTSSA